MNQEIDKYVAQAIVEIAVFLEFSGDDVINQDSAMNAFEQLASTLQKSDLKTKLCLREGFLGISKEYAGEQMIFVENLADALGLGGE